MIYFTWEQEEGGRRGAKSSLALRGFLQGGRWGGERGCGAHSGGRRTPRGCISTILKTVKELKEKYKEGSTLKGQKK